jgi:mannose-6-phosphate isomerase-like protein (cupin superfamily)
VIVADRVNLAEKLASFEETWVPKVVGELNGQYVKVAKAEGEYVWHHHQHEDEMFLVVEGQLDIHLRDRVVELRAGELFIVPRGVEHKPVARGRAHFVLFEPAATRNTGNVDHAFTIEAADLEKI